MGKRKADEARQMMAAAWHNAAFQRARRMPPLHRIIGDTERPAQSGEEIAAALKLKFGVKDG